MLYLRCGAQVICRFGRRSSVLYHPVGVLSRVLPACRVAGGIIPTRNADRKSGVRTRIAAFCFRIYFVQTSTTVMPSETSKFWRDSILPA